MESAAGAHGRAAHRGARAVRGHGGIALHHAHSLGGDAELSRRQLGKHPLVALARGAGAHLDVDVTLCVHAHGGRIERRHAHGAAFAIIGRTGTRVFDKADDPNPEIFVSGPRLGLLLAQPVVIGQAQHPLQSLRVIAAVVQAAGWCGVGKFVRLNEIAAPHLGRVEPKPGGNHVHDALNDKNALHGADPAVGTLRAFVGEQTVGLAVEMRHAVRTHDRLTRGHGLQTGADGTQGVCSLIDEDFGADGGDGAVAVDRHRHLHLLFMRVGARQQVFAAVFHPLDGPLQTPG